MMGVAKLLIGLLFGVAALAWMKAFPITVLGAFLVLAGITLAQASKFWQGRIDLVVAPVAAIVYLATNSLLAGFAAGWAVHLLLVRLPVFKAPIQSAASTGSPAEEKVS